MMLLRRKRTRLQRLFAIFFSNLTKDSSTVFKFHFLLVTRATYDYFLVFFGAAILHVIVLLFFFQGFNKFDFAVLNPPEPLGHPFDSKFDFCLACDECFYYKGFGPDGYEALPKLDHRCQRWVLLVREKGRFDLQWKKVRPKPQVSVCFSKEYVYWK